MTICDLEDDLRLFLYVEEDGGSIEEIKIENDKYVFILCDSWRFLQSSKYFYHVLSEYSEFYYRKGLFFKSKIGVSVTKDNFEKWKKTIETYDCDAEFHCFKDVKTNLGELGEVIFDQRQTPNRFLLQLYPYHNNFFDQATKRIVKIKGKVKRINE